ncbi:unnamed protein product [Somion occarium]|uniref:Uncharacterized protein n=1 Tax=Somion occarium TaxID=3059160 RepID=A0ABP1DN15_9APHY
MKYEGRYVWSLINSVFNREYVWRLTTRDTPDGVLDDPYNLDGSDLRPSRQITETAALTMHAILHNRSPHFDTSGRGQVPSNVVIFSGSNFPLFHLPCYRNVVICDNLSA